MARWWTAVGFVVVASALALGLAEQSSRAAPRQGVIYQPDLIVTGISDNQGLDCTRPAGINVTVKNAGSGPAGPSKTRVSATAAAPRLLDTPALGGGEQVTLYSSLTSIPIGDTYTAEADYNNDVAESNESNNSLSQFLVLATLPTCTPTRTPTPTPTSTPVPGLPDLIVKGMGIELESGGDCNFQSTQLGVRVTVSNTGDATAGPFSVQVNDAQQYVVGLAVHSTINLWFPGYMAGKNTAFVDVNMQVAEQYEYNNQASKNLPIPTLPATCTPTPPTPLAGDANKDGVVNAIDAALVLQYSAGLTSSINPRADANENGRTDAIDAALILQYGAGLLSHLPPYQRPHSPA